MEEHLRADRAVVEQPRQRLGKVLAPYLLTLPGGLWLALFFVVPFVTMLSMSLYTGNIDTGFSLTWHFGEYWDAISTNHKFFVRSISYATAVTVSTLLVGYPVAYWIAFHARRKTVFLFLLLLPFFVSFVIRTVSWEFILADDGIVFGNLKSWHLLPANFHILATSWAVIAGIAYNSLPFMILPLYVSLEKIDRAVVEAASDLYSNKTQVFTKVIFPLSVPGIFAGILLTFVPAAGDYVNASILGGVGTTLIGNIIQTKFLTDFDYPMSSALSLILMAALLVGILAYAKLLGTRQIEEYV